MKLTEALSGSSVAGARRSDGFHLVMVHQSRCGYHLTRFTPDAQGQLQSIAWTFLNLYDQLVFARTQGFVEVDAAADDWQAVDVAPPWCSVGAFLLN